MIGAEEAFRSLKSYHDPTGAFLEEMRKLGHATADAWLAANLAQLGARSSVDLSAFADPLIRFT